MNSLANSSNGDSDSNLTEVAFSFPNDFQAGVGTRSPVENAAGAAAMLLIFIITLVGNIAVILAIRFHRPLCDNVSNQFVLNLAATDLTSALLVVLWSAVAFCAHSTQHYEGGGSGGGGNWVFGAAWCSLQCAANYCCIVSSMLTLGFISLDRYAHVVYPLCYHDVITPLRMRCMLAWTWTQGIVVGVLPVAFSWVHYDYDEVVCAVNWQLENTVTYVSIAFATCFVLPGATMVVCYVRIVFEIRTSIRSVRTGRHSRVAATTVAVSAVAASAVAKTTAALGSLDSTAKSAVTTEITPTSNKDQDLAYSSDLQSARDRQQHPTTTIKVVVTTVPTAITNEASTSDAGSRRMLHRQSPPQLRTKLRRQASSNQQYKVIQSMLIVVLLFFLCMTPFCVTKLLKVMGSQVPGRVNTVATAIQYLSSAVNPFIYGMFRRDFQCAFRSQLRKLCRYVGWHSYADKISVSPVASALNKP